jgi:hypothetical protein
MGTLDGIEILLAEMGDSLELLNMIEEVGTVMDAAEPFPAIMLVGIVLALVICLITPWASSNRL